MQYIVTLCCVYCTVHSFSMLSVLAGYFSWHSSSPSGLIVIHWGCLLTHCLSLRLLSYYPEWQHLTWQGRPLRCTHSLLEVTLSASQKSWFWFWLINGNYKISHFSVQIINQVIRLLITYGNRGDLFIWRECTEVKTNKWQIALECFPSVVHVAVLNTKPLLLVLSFSVES